MAQRLEKDGLKSGRSLFSLGGRMFFFMRVPLVFTMWQRKDRSLPEVKGSGGNRKSAEMERTRTGMQGCGSLVCVYLPRRSQWTKAGNPR